MKTYWSGGATPHILNISTRWRCMDSFTPWLFYPWGKSSQYPLDGRLGRPQNQSECGGGEKISSLPLPGNETWSSSPQTSHYTD